MKRKSIWQSAAKNRISFETFSGKSETEVVIIGGGITGLTTALQLAESGKNVILLEARQIGSGTSGLSSCHLTTDIDEEFRNLVETFDLETASLVAESRQSGIDFIEKVVKDKNIDCGFQRVPGYFYTEIPEHVSIIKEEFGYAAQTGLDVKLTDSVPLPFNVRKAVRFENQAEFNCSSYLFGLAGYLKDKIRIFENSQATNVEKQGEKLLVQTSSGSILADEVVMATHLPLFFNVLQTVSSPYISYMVAARLRNAEYAEGLFWDTSDPYYYTRYYRVGEDHYVVVGGSDHKTGHSKNTRKKLEELEKYVRKRFDITEVEFGWSAQYYEPADGLPYIGKSPFSNKLYVATGFSGDGLVYGTIAGIIISDLILGNTNNWHKVYDSTRFTPVASASDFIKENADVAKRFVKDRIKAEEEDLNDIKKGEGKIVRIDGEPTAIMRDENDELKAVSAVCPHLKCLVNWNSFEQTWDCPCHGSRFEPDGSVIYGPASKCLHPKTIEVKTKDDNHQKEG